MNLTRGTVWDGVVAATVLFIFAACAFGLLLRWVIRREARHRLPPDWRPTERE